ncbi:MAG TPA: flagellar basal-body rod protein FlgG [Armatimonadetes bacterium]|nr:flagellar basal-body rod protein FlgG [Armatimonadota bacterium]
MLRALFTASTGMSANQLNIDIIANNLANVATTGFKKSRLEFQDLLYQTIRLPGMKVAHRAQAPTGIQVGLGVRPSAAVRIFTQGDLQRTENPLDLAIEGDGFFQVLLPDGTVAYTRDGAFKLDSEGRIVTADGFPIYPEIVIPPDAESISVGTDGTVCVTLPGQKDPQEVGRIELARFINPAGLKALGRNLFQSTAASGDPITGAPGSEGFGTIAQGFLEMSNVNVVEELVRMILALRAYEVNSKIIQAGDEMLSIANRLRR